MSRAGLNRAEGQVVTSAAGTDRVLIQAFNSNTGQYEPRQITITNFLAVLSAFSAPSEMAVEEEVVSEESGE
jgi:hypothetical protein